MIRTKYSNGTQRIKHFYHQKLVYLKHSDDGDSSIWSSLISNVPWGFAVEKVEGASHSVKCFCSQLEGLVANPSYKGRGKLTESMRKWLTRATWCAIVM